MPLGLLLGMLLAYALYRQEFPNRFTPADFAIVWQAAQQSREVADQQLKKNQGIVHRIHKVTSDAGYTPSSRLLLQKAERIQQLAHQLSDYIQWIDSSILQERGGVDSSLQLPVGYGQPIQANPAQINSLQHYLIAFADTCRRLTGLPLTPVLTESTGREHAFYETYFNQTPLAIGLYSLRRLEIQLRMQEHQALEQLRHQVGNDADLKASLLLPLVTAESEVVREGEPYQATLTLIPAFNLSKLGFRYHSSLGDCQVDSTGTAQLSFTAQARHFDSKGLSKQTFTASLTFQNPYTLRDTTFRVTEAYYVRKR